MVPRDQPGVVGTAARLPSRPGSQNEMPLSSAREISGEHARAAVAATKLIHRIFDSIRAIANLHVALATRAGISAAHVRTVGLRILTQTIRPLIEPFHTVGHKQRWKSVAIWSQLREFSPRERHAANVWFRQFHGCCV